MYFESIIDRPINIAIIGYGHIAKKHIAAIKEYPEALNLCAICDANPEVIERASQELGIDGFTSIQSLVNESNIDIVVICTPSGLHASQTIELATAGKHIICEKPLATRWKDSLEAVKACDTNGVRLFVVKQNRANPTLQLLKNAIEQNRFGRIFQMNINMFWTRPQEYYSQSKWRGSWEFDGGALMNQASHYIDLLHWLFGPVEAIQALTATQARQIESEDSAVLNIRWRSGTLGSMNVSMLTYPKNLESSLTVIGEKGTVRIGGRAINHIEHWEFATPDPMDESIQEASQITTETIGAGHIRYYQNIIDVLKGKAAPETDGRDGLKTMEILTAAYISARDRKTVWLPLEF